MCIFVCLCMIFRSHIETNGRRGKSTWLRWEGIARMFAHIRNNCLFENAYRFINADVKFISVFITNFCTMYQLNVVCRCCCCSGIAHRPSRFRYDAKAIWLQTCYRCFRHSPIQNKHDSCFRSAYLGPHRNQTNTKWEPINLWHFTLVWVKTIRENLFFSLPPQQQRGYMIPGKSNIGSISRKNGDATMKFITPPAWMSEHDAKWKNITEFTIPAPGQPGHRGRVWARESLNTVLTLAIHLCRTIIHGWYSDHKTVDDDFKLLQCPKKSDCIRVEFFS